MVKTKKRSFTIAEKLAIIEDIENGRSQRSVCRSLNLNSSTVSCIWQSRHKIRNDSFVSGHQKKMRTSKHPQVDELLYKWYLQQTADGLAVNGPMLQSKAEEFGRMIGDEFNCSNGWLDRFKKRHGMCKKTEDENEKKEEENESNDQSTSDDWLTDVWPNISGNYTKDNIFSAEEMGLFYKVMPENAEEYRNQTCAAGELAEDRLTVLLCVNAAGNEKRRLLVIGKNVNPDHLKHIQRLPIDYYDDKKAWMTPTIFEDYLKKWDSELIKKNKKVLFLVTNSLAHPQVKLRNIKLHYFSPGMISTLQPLHQGIISSFRQLYRKYMLLKVVEYQENNISTTITPPEAINILSVAWKKFCPEIISNSFWSAGLFENDTEQMFTDFDNSFLVEWLNVTGSLEHNQFEEYASVDSALVTRQENDESESIKEEEIETDNEETNKNVVTTQEALLSLYKLRQYFLQSDNDDLIVTNLNEIQESLQNRYIKDSDTQKKIANLFVN
ncbi:tigger transposable element-derived protein 4-like [Sitophilus oryzae]|uniref:Tigger transposable element-derived protein 4-like n=1 Tax=Sitophilus oryzae TaxID=7048 RepID=A0A6J2XTA6_SITOR|nr:tigger transposable element-derived protein 4-like [Sitophilus oryzae]